MSVDFYRRLYEQEWDRRSDVRQAASIPIGVLTLLGGILVFLGRSYSQSPGWLSVAFWVSFATAAGAFVVAVYMLFRSLFGEHYRRLPWPAQLRDYEEGLRRFYGADRDDAFRQEWESFLVDRYVDAANRNSENNANAGEYVHKANRAAVVALVMVAIGAVPVIVGFRSSEDRSHKVEVTNLKEMRDERSEREADRTAAERSSASGKATESTTAGSQTSPPSER